MGQQNSSEKRVQELVQASLAGKEHEVLRALEAEECALADTDIEGNTVLLGAACGGHLALVRRLLDMGTATDMNATNKLGCSAAWIAAGYGHTTVLEELVHRGADVRAANASGDTPLLAAVSRGHVDVVRTLLKGEARADVQKCNARGDSPLLVAIQRDDATLVEELLAAGADADATNAMSRLTALHVAASTQGGQHMERVIELLLQAGARRDAVDKNGATPLAVAAHCGATALVELLIAGDDGRAQLETADAGAATPLWIAAAGGKEGVLTALLAAGADASRKNGKGVLPAEAAAQNGHDACAALLRESTGAPQKI